MHREYQSLLIFPPNIITSYAKNSHDAIRTAEEGYLIIHLLRVGKVQDDALDQEEHKAVTISCVWR